MPHSTFQQLTASLIQEATGSPADDGVLDRVQAMLADVGLHDDRQIPVYFFDGIRGILARTLVPWVRVPEQEQGLGWILCGLADVVPGTTSEEVGAYDRFAAPALGHGMVVHRRRDDAAGYSEWYAVEALDASGRPIDAPPPRPVPTILGTFQPTTDQIRRWAYDPDLYFASQDEERAIDDLGFLDLLVELASDPHGPKRARLRDVIHTIGPGRVLGRRNDARAAVAAVAAALRASRDPELRADAAAAEAIVAYLDGQGPASAVDARAIARYLLASPARPSPAFEIAEVADWWQVTARRGETPVIELLYVHQATGALTYRRGSPLAPAELAALPAPTQRYRAQ
jgi:hypothetical protein